MRKVKYNNKTQYFLYFIAPIYNVNISKELTGKTFDGYKILQSKVIFEKYKNELYKPEALFEDIKLPYSGMMITRPTASYAFVKKIYLQKVISKETMNENDAIIENEAQNLTNLIIAMRLLKAGNIQVNRVYALGKREYRSFNLHISSFLDTMYNHFIYNNDYNFLNNYDISKKDLNKILKLKDNLTKSYKNLWIPISNFMSYYKTPNIADRLIKLCTIWEVTILNDCESELNYKLMVRGSAFLEKDLSDMFKKAYDIRSKLLHTGEFPKSKKLANLIKDDNKTDISKVFIFLRDSLEPITREIINKFIKNHIRTGKTLRDLAEDIDKLIYKKLTRHLTLSQNTKEVIE